MKGDFTGFTINGIHSSDLGIIRIADGDRYDETLIPNFEDKTIDIPGNDGSYYYGSFYEPREFKINIAFDHLTDEQFKKLRQLTSNRKLFPLVFDEAPYKVYNVKASAAPELHYICFDEGELEYTSENHNGYIPGSINHIKENSAPQKIYKGEGDLNFIAYNPFGYAPEKTLEEYSAYDNIDEWANVSGIHSTEAHNGYDEYNNDNTINVYNPGDISTPFKLYIPFNGDTIPAFILTLQKKTGENSYINVEGASLKIEEIIKDNEGHSGVLINTKNGLIEGAIEGGSTTITERTCVYNQYATLGNFFRIPGVEDGIPFDGRLCFSADVKNNGSVKIDYNYLYF